MKLRKRTKTLISKVLLQSIRLFAISLRETIKFVGQFVLANAKVVLVLLALLWFWDNKVDSSFLKNYLSSSRSEFQAGEVSKVRVDCRDNTLIEHTKGQPPKITSGVKYVDGSLFEDGHVEIKAKNKGLGLEPGIVATAGDGLRLGLDIEWIYWRRWGIVTGVTYPVRARSLNRLRGHTGLSYDLPSKWLSNTSIYAGIDSLKTPTIGFRTRLGGGI